MAEIKNNATAPNPTNDAPTGQFFLEKILQKRLIAKFIDLVIVGVLAILATLPAMVILPKSPVNFATLFGFFVAMAAAAVILIKDIPFKFYDLDGQTPGKKAMNIRVTDLQGNPITMQMSIHRNIIPALPYVIGALANLLNVVQIPVISGLATFFVILPLMGAAVLANIFEVYKIYSGERNRRWGDEFAGTIVACE